MATILQWVLIAVSIPVIVMLVHHTWRRARTLSERIDEYREEQEAQQQQPGPINPYSGFGTILDTIDTKRKPKPEDPE